MDSARDFDLLGESVPKVRVSARTLALLGFFQLKIYSYSLRSDSYIYIYFFFDKERRKRTTTGERKK